MSSHRCFFTLLLASVLGLSVSAATPAPAETETVLVTYRVQPGQEPVFLTAIKKTWDTYRRLDVVFPAPHTLLREVDEAGRTTYIEFFRWRSGEIPNHAPPEIREAWKRLEAFCKQPDGKSGIDAEEVTVVSSP